MERRDFLKSCGAAVVGLSVFGAERVDRLTPKALECMKQPFHTFVPAVMIPEHKHPMKRFITLRYEGTELTTEDPIAKTWLEDTENYLNKKFKERSHKLATENKDNLVLIHLASPGCKVLPAFDCGYGIGELDSLTDEPLKVTCPSCNEHINKFHFEMFEMFAGIG